MAILDFLLQDKSKASMTGADQKLTFEHFL